MPINGLTKCPHCKKWTRTPHNTISLPFEIHLPSGLIITEEMIAGLELVTDPPVYIDHGCYLSAIWQTTGHTNTITLNTGEKISWHNHGINGIVHLINRQTCTEEKKC